MREDSIVAESYRQRAAALEEQIKDLPAAEQSAARRYQEALLHLAAIDEWAKKTPKGRLFKDYKLNPRPLPPTSAQALSRFKTR